MATPDTPNGRVTLAVLRTELEHLTAEVRQNRDEVRELRAEIRSWQSHCEGRLRELEQYREGTNARWSAHQDQHNTERGVLGAISVIFSAISGFVGVFVKRA